MARKLTLLTLLVLVAAPAKAADHQVAARDNVFDPATVTIAVGDTVTWRQAGILPHNVKFDDGSFEQPSESTSIPWTATRRFDGPGTFRYYCEAHGGPNGVGMAGRVVVGGPDNSPPVISNLAADPKRFCNRRSCRRRGTTFKFRLSEDADVAGTITAVGSPSGRKGAEIESGGSAGDNSIRYSGRGLRPGRYRLSLTATDSAGNRSEAARTSFRVRRPR